MSNLRDRLKKIASEKKQSPEGPKSDCPKVKPCAVLTGERPAPNLNALSPDILSLMGGEDFAGSAPAPSDWVFIDTETTGLSGGVGTIAFEIGIGEIVGDRFLVTQLYIRDYDEEEDMLARFCSKMQGKRAIVSFNGKAFDLPLLISRCRLHRISVPFEQMPHMDLLYPTRRLYKLRLRQCSLTHIEETVLGIHREGDIPGGQIPALWAQYLRDKQDAALQQVFSHNFEDVVSMGTLFAVLYAAHRAPANAVYQEDLFSLARIYDRAGQQEVAESCYVSINKKALKTDAGKALSRIYRKSGRISDMERLYLELSRQSPTEIYPLVELAKLCEHRLRDYPRAMHYTDEAIKRTMNASDLAALTRRRQRLYEKANRKDKP